MSKVTWLALTGGLLASCADAGEADITCAPREGADPQAAQLLCAQVARLAPVGSVFTVDVIAATTTALEAQLINGTDNTVAGPLRLSQKDAILTNRAFTQLATALIQESTL